MDSVYTGLKEATDIAQKLFGSTAWVQVQMQYDGIEVSGVWIIGVMEKRFASGTTWTRAIELGQGGTFETALDEAQRGKRCPMHLIVRRRKHDHQWK